MEITKGNCQPCASAEKQKTDREKADEFLKMMRDEMQARATKGTRNTYPDSYSTDTKISELTKRVEKLEKLLEILSNKEELERLKKILEIE